MKKHRVYIGILLSTIGLFVCAALSLSTGSRYVSVDNVISSLIHNSADNFDAYVVHARIPRTIFSLLIGCALGVAGTLMQSITRNPIADPSILGVNSGASFFVVCGISFFGITSSFQFISFALVGASITAIFVYGIGSLGRGGATPLKLALAGTAAATALSSLTTIIMLPKGNVMDSFRFWQIGSVSGGTYEKIMLFIPFVVVGLVISFLISSQLNILALGDDAATGLGAKPMHIRLLGAVAGVLLCASATALAGPIGFVGLMVPHVIRMLLSSDMRILLPFSAIGGALLLTLSDIIGRMVGGIGEVEVGIITAVLGGPLFVIIVMKAKVKSL